MGMKPRISRSGCIQIGSSDGLCLRIAYDKAPGMLACCQIFQLSDGVYTQLAELLGDRAEKLWNTVRSWDPAEEIERL